MTANAVAAQRPTQRYLNSVRELAIELEKNIPAYAEISLTEYFDDNVTNVILEQTHGSEPNLDIGTFASSIAELAEWKAKEQEEITNRVIEERNSITGEFDKQTKTIIEGAIEKNKNNLGFLWIPLLIILLWPIITTALFAMALAVISNAIGNWHILWIALIIFVATIVEELCSSKFIMKMMLKFVLPKAERAFENRIMKELRQSELPYKDNILEQVKLQTGLLTKCRRLLK